MAKGEGLTRFHIDLLGRSWSVVADLFSWFQILYAWDASLPRILIWVFDVASTYREDAVQELVDWVFAELTLHAGNSPVI